MRRVASGLIGQLAWSRSSREFIYGSKENAHLVTAASARDRAATTSDINRVGWDPTKRLAPNRRWAASLDRERLAIVRGKDGVVIGSFAGVLDAAWSPDGNRLAIENRDFIRVFDARTRRVHRLAANLGFSGPPQYGFDLGFGLTWSPDGRRIAYVSGKQSLFSAGWSVSPGDLMTSGLSGLPRTLVSRDHAYGGRIEAVAWATVPRRTVYTPADSDPGDRITASGLLANGTVERLAADGSRVAFIACDNVFVWTPSTGELQQRRENYEQAPCAFRDLTGRYLLYDLALAGNRVAYALMQGCNSISLTLYTQQLSTPAAESPLADSFGNCGSPFPAALGRMAGSGDLLVFGQWRETGPPGPPPDDDFPVAEASVHTIDPAGCPCPTLVSTGGPLYSADVDASRIVVYGTNQTLVLDRNGQPLMTLPVSPSAAQLSGNDLILLLRGELRYYDIRGAAPLHRWPLPDVASGPVCAWIRCNSSQRLTLEDASHGLVAYVIDGNLHVLRLADGADRTIGEASLARFMDAGIVYADGARLRLVSFDKLLRAF